MNECSQNQSFWLTEPFSPCNCSQCWPREDLSCRETGLFLWRSAHMFPIWSSEPPLYVWNGAEPNSAQGGMWSVESRPDGTPSDRLRGRSQTLLTETRLIDDSRPDSAPPFVLQTYPRSPRRSRGATVGKLSREPMKCTESFSCVQVFWKYVGHNAVQNNTIINNHLQTACKIR